MFNLLLRPKKIILIFLISMVFTQPFAQLEIKKYSINNGGTTMASGNYQMRSSIGQIDASSPQTTGNYSLTGGFWTETTTASTPEIFKNGFE